MGLLREAGTDRYSAWNNCTPLISLNRDHERSWGSDPFIEEVCRGVKKDTLWFWN